MEKCYSKCRRSYFRSILGTISGVIIKTFTYTIVIPGIDIIVKTNYIYTTYWSDTKAVVLGRS